MMYTDHSAAQTSIGEANWPVMGVRDPLLARAMVPLY
jgi:hypothetical protein